MRSGTLLVLVGVDVVVALTMVVSLAGFVLAPDPAVKAGAMYVTLGLITGASLLMAFMALNASFLPFLTRDQAPSVGLVMWAMAGTGVVTGMLTLGGAVNSVVMRLGIGIIAYLFISIQNTRLAKARAAASDGRAAAAAPQTQQTPRSRQRRGGRKR